MTPIRDLISNGASFKYVDAHCHIQFEQYEEDDSMLIEQMRNDGVAVVVVGVDYESSKKAVELAMKHEHLYASVGLHPNRTELEPFHIWNFQELAKSSKVVAIGECGLDYYRLPTNKPACSAEATKEKQKEILQKHIELAVEIDRPLIIHARPSKGTMDAYTDLIEILEEAKATHGEAVRGDIHFFVGGIIEAKALIALGFTISFTAVITFARDYDDIIKAVSLTSILSETDSPYVAPISRRGQRNDPLAVIDVVTKIAEIRGEPLEHVRKILLDNSRRMFAI
jgi:TatD DNase family protein